MTHSHWPLITRKNHIQPKMLQNLQVLNEYKAFRIGWRHLELVLTCPGTQTRSPVAKFEI